MNETDKTSLPEAVSRQSIWLPLLGCGLIVAVAAIVDLGSQLRDLRHQFATSQQETAELRNRIAGMDSKTQSALNSLRDDVASVVEQTNASLAMVQNNATRHADDFVNRIGRKQDQQTRQLENELTKVKESTLKASNQLDGITNQVGSVKTGVDTAKTDIQDTKSELQRARGDLGMMSGLIATNAKEIRALRDVSDRNIFEFNLAKSAGMQKIGDIQVMLRKTDTRHNGYSVTAWSYWQTTGG